MITAILKFPFILFFTVWNYCKKFSQGLNHTELTKKPNSVSKVNALEMYNKGFRDGIKQSFKQINGRYKELLRKYTAEVSLHMAEFNTEPPKATHYSGGGPTHNIKMEPYRNIEYHATITIKPKPGAVFAHYEELQ